jgi:hypothetical protein
VLGHAKVVDADGRGDIPPRWCVSVLWGLCRSGIHPQLSIPERALRLDGRSKNIIGLSRAWLYLFSLLSFGTRVIPTWGRLVGAATKL